MGDTLSARACHGCIFKGNKSIEDAMHLSARVKQLFEDQEQVTSREIREAVMLWHMTRLDDADNGAVQQHVMQEFKEGRLPFSKGFCSAD